LLDSSVSISMIDYPGPVPLKAMRSGASDVLKFWEICDISEPVQD